MMLRFFFVILFIHLAGPLLCQQLYVEAFTGRNRTNYNISPYQTRSGFFPLGLRIAAGADHIQLGAELSGSFTKPNFEIRDTLTNEIIGEHEFSNNYYGLFIRGKYSRYPARRFGITFIAGLGYLDAQRKSTVESDINNSSYDKAFSYNGGIGISIPTQGMGMVELGYHYYHSDLEEKNSLPTMAGSYHSFHLGFSLNFVFGKRKEAYKVIGKKL